MKLAVSAQHWRENFRVPAASRPDFNDRHVRPQAEKHERFLWMPVLIARLVRLRAMLARDGLIEQIFGIPIPGVSARARCQKQECDDGNNTKTLNHHGRLTRIFLSVSTTKHPRHPSIALSPIAVEILSLSPFAPGSRKRTRSRPG